MVKGESHIPKLRFKGFSDEWKAKTFKTVLTEIKRPLKMKDDENYQLITVKRRNEGIVSRGIFQGKNILVKSQFEVKAGDYIISKRQVVHGANGIVPLELDGAIVSNEYLVAHGSEHLDINYFSIISNLPDMYQKFFLSSYGVDIEKLFFDVNDWKKRTVNLPELKEQSQIGNFFQKIDQVIELQQKALDTARDYKKSMLQKMFPQKGEKVPQIRFDGFSEDWEEEQLGDIGKIESGYGFSESEQNGKVGIPFYKVSDMNSLGNETEMFVANHYITEIQAVENKWKIINNFPSVIFAKVGAAVMLNRKRLVRHPFLIDNNLMAYSFSKDAWDVYFGKTTFDTLFLPQLAQTGALPSFNASDIKSLKVLVPRLLEQQKIGKFFQKLDQRIEQHEKKLESYQNLKKAMLQRLFV